MIINKHNHMKEFDLRKEYHKISNYKIRSKCKKELCRTFGWKGASTFPNYLSVGIDSRSPYIPKIISIIQKYVKKEEAYLAKSAELDDILNE